MAALLERLFHLRERRTSVGTEVIAGLVTFLTMAYIIAVNPLILHNAGIPVSALVAATCLGAAIPTLLMGLFANWPLALAPGMGLNAALTYSVVLGMGVSWQTAMGIIFIEGVLIAVLVLAGVRERVMQAVPDSLKAAIGIGIGLFIAFIGMQHAGFVVKSDATMVAVGDFKSPATLISALGLLMTAALHQRRVPGALLLGIVSTTIFASIAERFLGVSLVSLPNQLTAMPDFSTFGKLDIVGALSLKLVATVFTFLMTDFFDTMGTVVGVGTQAKLKQGDGTFPHLNRVLLIDSLAAVWGGICGASSVTSYIESGSGVSDGGRTGLTSVVVALLFLLALFFAPLVSALPSFATAPALIAVGFLFLSQLRDIPFDRYEEAFPAFVTLLAIPLTFSISKGIALGFLAYLLLALVAGKAKSVSPILYVLGVLFAISLVL